MDNFVSIIVPMYNSSKTIDRCLKSILNQSYKNFKVIIINDGSTDNCDEIVKNYQKSGDRIVLINQENAGVSKHVMLVWILQKVTSSNLLTTMMKLMLNI